MLYSTRAGQRDETPAAGAFSMRRLPLILFCAAIALLVVACGSGGPQSVSDDSVAVVGDEQISKAEWEALIAQTRRNFAATKRKFPAAGSDTDIDARLEKIKKQYYGNPAGQQAASEAQMEKRYRAALKQQGFTDEEVRNGIKLQVLREKVFAKVTSDVKVTDEQIKAYYDKNKKQYETPAQPESRDVRHILVKTKKQANQLYAQLQANPGKFAALARKNSTDTSSAKNGGKLPPGTAVKGRLVPEFEKVAFAIKAHVISKPVHSQFGWHIIEALGPVKSGAPAKPTPLSQVKEAIRQQLLSQNKQKEMDKWLAGIKKSYCKKIGYQKGYAPPPGQDPCKQPASTTGSSTTTG